MLIDNKNYLRLHNRDLLNILNRVEINSEDTKIEKSKTGELTLKMFHRNVFKYVHSKYDPIREMSRLVDQFELEEGKKHILLFGLGLGYHYTSLKEKFPDVTFTVYEPSEEVLASILGSLSLKELFGNEAIKILTNRTINQELRTLLQTYNNQLQIFTLPFYEKLYKQELNDLYQYMVDHLKNKKSTLVTNVSFQKRWTLNAVKNLPKIINTPNVLKDIDKSQFEDKPAIIVSAGPSLDFEYENLRKIKEKGLAYIFSVGSSINSLIEHGIYPDAACTYDPTERNQIVFEKLKAKQIRDIPLIFGSTVGYETIEDYPGEMFHMITSQDTITPFLLNEKEDLEIVIDAPSIAVVTFQLLANLGFRKVILVGQNLAYDNNKSYASGIEYGGEINDNKLISVENVNGETVYTEEGFDRMRKQLELYINSTTNVEVYNTTVNGAKIKGTVFLRLEDVIQKYLNKKEVDNNWLNNIKQENAQFDVLSYKNQLYKSKMELGKITKELLEIIQQCNEIPRSNSIQIENKLIRFDKYFKKMKKNMYYKNIVSQMMRVQIERLSEDAKDIKLVNNIGKKLQLIELHFGSFINEVSNHIDFIEPHLEESLAKLKE
ncbi:motility associated factor glycosyltransferase family protein [Gracilibacillus kekensis]|uniref:Uncharacterized conserved protein n=1 Tax=Gracilibacillus kekensis TaxID=1027249 RepID=A0A1M7N0X5_9BACI|nr:6-hydroxymethylpterin diphosphokinase MptE-like protein [Gracilibacillus kekensis]SHM96616.1 Uncharacterized conserved protein [Gracilibacillus kekensis]